MKVLQTLYGVPGVVIGQTPGVPAKLILGIGGGIDAINNISHGIRRVLKDQDGLAGSNPALCPNKQKEK